MMTFHGVVTLDEAQIPAMVGLENEMMSLVAGEVPIGEWPADQYVVIDLGEGTFVIEVEEESISFHPDDPRGFARGIRRDTITPKPEPVPTSDTIVVREGPPPQASTVAAFYTLVVVTAALAIWAFISLF